MQSLKIKKIKFFPEPQGERGLPKSFLRILGEDSQAQEGRDPAEIPRVQISGPSLRHSPGVCPYSHMTGLQRAPER